MSTNWRNEARFEFSESTGSVTPALSPTCTRGASWAGGRVLPRPTSLVTSALEQALFTRQRHDCHFTSAGLVQHPNASQYTAIAFTQALCDAGIAPSIGTVGDALENALMESTIGLYKTELIDAYPRPWSCAAEVERETAGWVHWFNSTRLHSSIGHAPPIEYEQNYRVNTATSTGEVA